MLKHHRTDDGFLFWRDETFEPVNVDEGGAEVKVMGEYVWLPDDVYEILA